MWTSNYFFRQGISVTQFLLGISKNYKQPTVARASGRNRGVVKTRPEALGMAMNDNSEEYGTYLLATGNLWGSQIGNEISNIKSSQKVQWENEKFFSASECRKILMWWQLYVTVPKGESWLFRFLERPWWLQICLELEVYLFIPRVSQSPHCLPDCAVDPESKENNKLCKRNAQPTLEPLLKRVREGETSLNRPGLSVCLSL